MRLIAITVFALAATGATLAGSGLVVAPHIDPPGTPKYHDHVLAAYRLPIFLANMQARFDPGRGVLIENLADAATFAFVLALLTFAWPRLPRPTRRSIGQLAPARVAQAQWRPVLILGPPRG
ncbi:MAG: hypothetical protein M3O80_02520 [Chloroflexota bacterium]|nr:hypothetical protein [Chloroflexota bacterium]